MNTSLKQLITVIKALTDLEREQIQGIFEIQENEARNPENAFDAPNENVARLMALFQLFVLDPDAVLPAEPLDYASKSLKTHHEDWLDILYTGNPIEQSYGAGGAGGAGVKFS